MIRVQSSSITAGAHPVDQWCGSGFTVFPDFQLARVVVGPR